MRLGKKLAITNHAIERMIERMGIKEKQIRKIVFQALRSKEEVDQDFMNSSKNLTKNGYNTYFYKKHKGLIFVFQKKYFDVVLITVIKR
jgi:hypothetical protein